MNPLDDPIPDLPPESEWKAELEDLTDRFDEPTASVPFREALREQLGREVARHGHHRQWRRIAAALAIFVAGWAAGSFFGMTALAWIAAVIVYQVGTAIS